MTQRNHSQLVAQLQQEYTQRNPRSAQIEREAQRHLLNGANHMARHWNPFPFRITEAHGAYVDDVDGHHILDFWQGHYANILGHNPPEVTQPLAEAFARGWGLQSGMTDELEAELAALICARTGAEKIRLTTSGSLSTMYAIMMARAYTRKPLVLKVGGGWHGAQPWALKGIQPNGGGSYNHLESEGLPDRIEGEVLVTRFNDSQALADIYQQYGDRIACFIVEPLIGSGGYIAAQPEFLKTARELTVKYGTVLVLDEVIAGFRFRAGNMGALYGIQPDLMTLGKIVGGGMPLAAVAGRMDIMRLCERGAAGRRVRFDGGTYSAHPSTMLAGKAMIEHLVAHESEIYPRLAALGERTRRGIERIFGAHGIEARCTGDGNAAVPGSSMAGVQFPINGHNDIIYPEQTQDPAVCDIALREQVLKLGLLVQDVNVAHGVGALAMAHSDADVDKLLAACEVVAARAAKS
jgi:glutamate-1-semialdehyde 2,1-aminomutase